MQIESEQMRNIKLQACERKQQFQYQKEISQLRFKIAQLQRVVGTEIATFKGKVDDQERSPNSMTDDFDDSQFELLDEIHGKLQEVEAANIGLK